MYESNLPVLMNRLLDSEMPLSQQPAANHPEHDEEQVNRLNCVVWVRIKDRNDAHANCVIADSLQAQRE